MRQRARNGAAVRPGARGVRAVAAMLLLGLLGSSCEPAPEPEPVVRPVRSLVVRPGGGERVRRFAGVAEAGQESALSFKIPGTVLEVPVAVGAGVAAGDLIAALDRSDVELLLAEAEAALAQGRASARAAQLEYERVQTLYEDQNASRSDLDRARGQAEATAASQRAVETRVEQARLQLSYTRLVAPSAGSISQVAVDPGENVSAGQRVALLASGERLRVRIALPEALIAGVAPGAEAAVRFDSIGEQLFPARVTEVGVAASASSTFPVVVALQERSARALPGMAAQVELRFVTDDRESPAILLPPVCVGEDREGRFVWVLELEGESGFARTTRRGVEVGALTADGLEIRSGLREGERVVTAGARRIFEGQRVRVESQP